MDRLIASEIDLARKLSESQEAYATSIEERTKLRENIETEQQSQAAMSTAHAEHVHELEETIYDLRATIRRNESVVELATRDGEERLKKLLSDLEERNEKAESETNELVNSYEARIKAMEVEHSANHARALAEFAERADVAESRHEEAIQRAQRGVVTERKRMERRETAIGKLARVRDHRGNLKRTTSWKRTKRGIKRSRLRWNASSRARRLKRLIWSIKYVTQSSRYTL